MEEITTEERVRELYALVLRPCCVYWRTSEYRMSISESGILPKKVSPKLVMRLIDLGTLNLWIILYYGQYRLYGTFRTGQSQFNHQACLSVMEEIYTDLCTETGSLGEDINTMAYIVTCHSTRTISTSCLCVSVQINAAIYE